MSLSIYLLTACLALVGVRSDAPDWSTASLSDMYDNCEPLSSEFHVWWTMDRPSNTIWMALESDIDNDEFMAFGISGEADIPEMIGADVVVADFKSGSARARDFYLQDARPCNEQLRSGVCPDSVFNDGHDDVASVFGAQYADAAGRATVVHYQRPIKAHDPKLDRAIDAGTQTIVFAVGGLDPRSYPTGHRVVSTTKKAIDFGRERTQNCVPLMGNDRLRSALIAKTDRNATSAAGAAAASTPAATTPIPVIHSPPAVVAAGRARFQPETISDRVLVFSLGPSGVDEPPVVYYVNGKPAPALRLQRGQNYTFKIMTGRDSSEPAYYQPVVITPPSDAGNATAAADPIIGPAKGRLCLWSSSLKRQDVPGDFATFARSLAISCDQGPYDYFSWTPDHVTPDRLQYCSTTGAGLGGPIQIIDAN